MTPEQAAGFEVARLIEQDRAAIESYAGFYVPQLSAKLYGVLDPSTKILYIWEGILADHMVFRGQPHGALLKAPRPDDKRPFYRTLVAAPSSSEEGVKQWCSDHGYIYTKTCLAHLIKP